jgi:PAS domain S-box-containing protein
MNANDARSASEFLEEISVLRKKVEALETAESQRKRAEDALSDAAWLWQITFDTIPDALCILDENGMLLRANRAMLSLVGRPFSEVSGQACHEVLHGEACDAATCPVTSAYNSLGREVKSVRLGERWYSVVVDPLPGVKGRAAGAVHLMIDVTDRTRAESLLRESEEMYRLLIETLPFTVGIHQGGKVVFANSASLRMFRYRSMDEIIGMDMLRLAPERERPRLAGYAAARTRGTGEAPENYGMMLLRADGTEFEAIVTAKPITYRGRPAGQVIIMEAAKDAGG